MDGKTDNADIANTFKDKFCLTNYNSCVNIPDAISTEFLPCVQLIKRSTEAGHDNLTLEHINFYHRSLISHLCRLFKTLI